MKRQPTSSLLLLMSFLLLGAGRWDGITSSDDELTRWRLDVLFPEAIDSLHEMTREVGVDDLMNRCHLVLNEHLHSRTLREDQGGEQARVWLAQMSLRPDWLLCAVALRRVGETGEPRWLATLEEMHPLWKELFLGFTGIRIRSPSELLENESLKAFRAIVVDPLTTKEFLGLWLESRSEGRRGTFRARGLARAFNDSLTKGEVPVAELLELYEDPDPGVRYTILSVYLYRIYPEAPELLDAVVARMADPDPRVRQAATVRVTQRPPELPDGTPASNFVDFPVVIPLLRFLARQDIDEVARAAAIEGLRVRGYSAASGPDGRPMAVPLEGHARLDERRVSAMVARLNRTNIDEAERGRTIAYLRRQGYEVHVNPEGRLVAVSLRSDQPITLQ